MGAGEGLGGKVDTDASDEQGGHGDQRAIALEKTGFVVFVERRHLGAGLSEEWAWVAGT
jgi:hypothetical protein